MSVVTFKLKVLTPMFIGGAKPHGEPELRAASIRGAMRFWFRAMAGAVTNDPREVYRLESEIFGNTERKSKVAVRVVKQPESKDLNECFENKRNITYLGYGLYGMSGNPDRKCFSDNEIAEFEIEYPSTAEEAVAYSLWFISNVGGLGARSRKGFGSVYITTDEEKISQILNLSINDVLSKNTIIHHIENVFKKKASLNPSVPLFPSLFPESYEFIVFPTNINDTISLFKKLNRAYRNLRRYEFDKKERKYLGFSGGENKRRSSPLMVRPLKLDGNGNFSVLLFLFKSKFHPEIADPDFDGLWKRIVAIFKGYVSTRRYPNA